MKQLRSLLSIFILTLSFNAEAQNISFSANADTNRILIGEQIKLVLRAEMPKPQNYEWPVFPDSTDGLEIVRMSGIDTLEEKEKFLLSQEIYLTSFDSGYFAIPQMTFKSEGQLLNSEAIAIAVNYPDVSEEQGYYDIKKPLEVGRNWWAILLWAALIILAAVLIYLTIKYFIRKGKKEKISPELLIDPDIYALQQLEKLERDQIWQKGLYKEFYSRLIDILRIYLERQMGFSAMESTADEIIDDLKQLKLEKELNKKMTATLRLSALVKFAKAKPGPDENEDSLLTIKDFIEQTRPEKVEKEVKHVD